MSLLGCRLIVFVKAPRPGTVKTRLAATLGTEAACAAYCELATRLFANLRDLGDVELCFAPADAELEIQSWRHEGWVLRPQTEGDLGARMNSAFANAFAEGYARVLLIGSDCPEVSATDIGSAWDALAAHDLVLGPARDGGYWLIGLNRPQPALFDRIPWSTDRVLTETLHRAEEQRLRIHRLRELEDVDTAEDWRAYQTRRDSLEADVGGC